MLKKLKPKSEFSRNVLTLMTGTTIAQAIPIAISPILTRIYTPEDFGVLAFFAAIVSIFGSIANGRYELAIMLPKKDEDAINIFALGVLITSVVSIILLCVVILFNKQITRLSGNDEISFWLYFVPLTVFLMGIWNILNYFNNRKKQYKDIAKATIIKSIGIAIIQLSIGSVKSGVTGLITGQIISQFFANTKLLKNITKDKILISKVSIVKIIALAKHHKDFPKYSVPTTLLDVMSLQAPIFMLSSLYLSSAMVGFYSFANRILQFPSGLISSSIGQVFYQSFAQLQNDKNAQLQLLYSTWKKLFLLGIIPFSIIFFLGEEIFTIVFGQNWDEAGKIASILSPMIFAMFISSSTSSAFTVLRMQNIGLYFGIFVLFTRPLSIFLGYQMESFYIGLLIMVTVEMLQIVGYNVVIIKKIRSLN